MAPKFALFTKGSKLPLNKGFKNMFELLQSCSQPSNCSQGSKFFSFRVDLFSKGNISFDWLPPLKVCPVLLTALLYFCTFSRSVVYFYFYFFFLGLFSALEQKTGGSVSKAESMGIKSYGVSMTTLEEVFLKLGK